MSITIHKWKFHTLTSLQDNIESQRDVVIKALIEYVNEDHTTLIKHCNVSINILVIINLLCWLLHLYPTVLMMIFKNWMWVLLLKVLGLVRIYASNFLIIANSKMTQSCSFVYLKMAYLLSLNWMEVFENNFPPQIHTIQINERSYGQVFYFFAYIKSLTSYISESRLLKANQYVPFCIMSCYT